MKRRVAEIAMSMVLIAAFPSLYGCAGAENQQAGSSQDTIAENDYLGEEEDAMDSAEITDSDDETSSDSSEGQYFKGELRVQMVGQDPDKEIILPLSVKVESLKSASEPAVPETDVPADGTVISLGTSQEDWLQTRIVRLPVYSDMTTYNYQDINTTYWVDDSEMDCSAATEEIDLSRFGKVMLTKDYLSNLIGDKSAGYNMLQDMYKDVPPDDGDEGIARVQRRADALASLQGQLDALSTDDHAGLLSIYSQVCEAIS